MTRIWVNNFTVTHVPYSIPRMNILRNHFQVNFEKILNAMCNVLQIGLIPHWVRFYFAQNKNTEPPPQLAQYALWSTYAARRSRLKWSKWPRAFWSRLCNRKKLWFRAHFVAVSNEDFEWLWAGHYSCASKMVPEYQHTPLGTFLKIIRVRYHLQTPCGHTETTSTLKRDNTACPQR